MEQSVPEFTFHKDKPTWLLIKSDKEPGGEDMDKAFNQLQARFGKQIHFQTLNWEDEKTKSVIDRFSLKKAPSSVITDSKGRVVEKFEGAKDSDAMSTKLREILIGEREK